MKIKSNIKSTKNTFLALFISFGTFFIAVIVYLIVKIVDYVQRNIDINAMHNNLSEIIIAAGVLFVVTISFLIIFIVFNNKLKNKYRIIKEGKSVQAKIDKILEPDIMDRFALAGSSPSRYIAFQIVACTYDENGKCKKRYISEWFQGMHASKVKKILESKGIDQVTVFVDANDPSGYAFDLEEIESFLQN
ncbi:MAG: hypothetical protein IKI57_03030 [Clostridia bacterium]|nr:hypothetical protein [Clostridia bacterium]